VCYHFLSLTRQGDYSLSVKYTIVKHIKISRRGTKYEIAPDSKGFTSIQVRLYIHMAAIHTHTQTHILYYLLKRGCSLTPQLLIKHFQQHSLNRHFPGLDTMLSFPFRDAMGMTQGSSSQ
jgi:hypothetical protein